MNYTNQRKRNKTNRNGRSDINRTANRANTRRQVTLNTLASARSTSMIGTSFPATQEVRVSLAYPFKLLSAVNAYAAIEFRANDVFDPVGTGFSPVGVSVYLQTYRLFRVTHCRSILTIVNKEAVEALNVALIYSDTQPSTLISTWDDARTYASSGFTTRPRMVAGVGGQNRANMSYKVAMGNILGDNLLYNGTAGYAGSDIASPAQTIWGAVIMYATDAVTFPSTGLDCNLTLEFTVRFSSLRLVP